MTSPAAALVPGADPLDQNFTGFEETLGYRLTTDVTLRASHRARQSFGADSYGHTVAVSMVWWKRLL
jgi:hypothetical protein